MTKHRWINKTIDEAANLNHKMPWERGLRRQAMIARRVEETQSTAKVSLAPLPAWMTEGISA